ARFRIYRVDVDANETETVTEEIVAGNGIVIEWSVSLANRKAAGFRIAGTLARAARPGLRNDGLDRNKLVNSANGSGQGSRSKGPVLSGTIEFAKPKTTGARVTGIELVQARLTATGTAASAPEELRRSDDAASFQWGQSRTGRSHLDLPFADAVPIGAH